MAVAVYILLIIASLCAISLAVTALSLAPWVPCRARDLERIFRIAALKKNERFYDIGCGDGRVVLYAAAHFPAHAVGIELALPMYLWCLLKKRLLRQTKTLGTAAFICGNLFHTDLSGADVLYVFGMPRKMAHSLKKKMEHELKRNCRVISYAFPIEGWEPAHIDKPSPKDLPIYLYLLPPA